MASDAVQLELNDILFTLDSHLDTQTASGTVDAPIVGLDRQSRGITPEPPDEHEVLAMRTRALVIHDGKGKGNEGASSSELVDMVLRLTAAVPAREQLLEQAETIRRLSLQQDFLLRRMSDERDSWNAEQDSMWRVCEALIAQANIASHNLYKEQDNSKKPAVIEAENASLRQKLADAQSRAASLEAELAQLRPLLLMQPTAIAQSKGLTLSSSKPNKKEESNCKTGSAENRSYYRVREEKTAANSSPKSKKKKATSYFKHAPTVVDARSEHLLLAARKLGKERASMLSQAMYRTAEPQGPSTAPNHDLTMHIKGSSTISRPMMTPAVWPNHVQQSTQAGQQTKQQGQQSGTAGPAKGQQNPPFSQYGPPSGVAYPHPQQYFMPPGSIARPGTAMPAPTFYHAPARGYIPGPAWPYYSPGPYAFGQPIAIQNPGANASKASPGVRPATSPPVAGPSRTPAPSAPPGSAASPSAPSANQKDDLSSSQVQKAPSKGQQVKGLKTPQTKPTGSTSTTRNPPTPMDSLLSAAQTVFSPDSRSPSADGDGSPSPRKRRRVEHQRGQSSEKNVATLETSSNVDRRTSALDVLADQAAGVGSSSQRSRSVSRTRDESMRVSQNKTDKHKDSGEAATSADSGKLASRSGNQGIPRAPATRKGKRPTRASSTAPEPGMSSSLAPPIMVQRAASEEHTTSVASAPQGSGDPFKLRPVQIQGKNAPARSASVPRTGGPSTSRTGAGKGRQVNGRASTPLSRQLTRVPRASPSEADADAEGDDVESEDDMDAEANVNQIQENSPNSAEATERKGKGPSDPVGAGEDADSRRWLEILGRKDS